MTVVSIATGAVHVFMRLVSLQIGIITTKNKRAEKLTDLAGKSRHDGDHSKFLDFI